MSITKKHFNKLAGKQRQLVSERDSNDSYQHLFK